MEENEKIDIAVLVERQKVANHRIDDLEEKVSEFIDFKYTVKSLSDAVQDLKVTVNKLDSRDGNTFREIKKTILACTITTVLGAALGVVLSKLF